MMCQAKYLYLHRKIKLTNKGLRPKLPLFGKNYLLKSAKNIASLSKINQEYAYKNRMKVEGVSSNQAAALRRANGVAAPGFALPIGDGNAVQATRAAAATSAMMDIGSLLALQTIDSIEERRRRATRRANTLLDILDDVRVATLSGNVTRKTRNWTQYCKK
ncbi:MAG: flagellar assembly regulator FliX class II [Hyphomonadaceae bacterium]|nr:MAG: flagellar assembly regulator FliX class II [Hyphomonadaceae bacterium]